MTLNAQWLGGAPGQQLFLVNANRFYYDSEWFWFDGHDGFIYATGWMAGTSPPGDAQYMHVWYTPLVQSWTSKRYPTNQPVWNYGGTWGYPIENKQFTHFSITDSTSGNAYFTGGKSTYSGEGTCGSIAHPYGFFNHTWKGVYHYGDPFVRTSSDLVGLGFTPGRCLHRMAILDGNLYVMGGFSDYTDYPGYIAYHTALNDVWVSDNDGFSYSLCTSHAPWGSRAIFGCTTFDDKIWVIGGASESYFRNDIWSSPDGVNWTRELYPLPFHVRFIHGNQPLWWKGKYYIFGFGSQVPAYGWNDIDVWSSENLVEWSFEGNLNNTDGAYNLVVGNDFIRSIGIVPVNGGNSLFIGAYGWDLEDTANQCIVYR